MNKKDGNNNRSSSRPNSSRPNSNKPKPAMPKRAQNPKKPKPVADDAAPKRAARPAKAAQNNVPKPFKSDDIRLNKYISNSCVCSRRDADIYIQSGNVKVNGEVITEMGYKVQLNDVVNFDGSLITPEKKEYVLLNKPKGFTTSKEEDINSNNVLDLVRGATKAKLQAVGRMDKTTTGLLLFTNDTD